MSIDPISFIFLAITACSLAVILLVVVLMYVQTLKRSRQAEEANSNLRSELTQQPLELLAQAHEKALTIIGKANKEANDILAGTTTFEEEAKGSLKESLAAAERLQEEAFQKASQELQGAYQASLAEAKNESIKVLGSITKDIEEDAIAEFKDFTSALEKETIHAEKIAKEKIDEKYLELEKEVEAYKLERYKKMDEEIYKILYKVSELVLSQSIPIDQHKQLVLESLEEAKKEQVFQ
jgi:hypothetical protein